MMKSANSDMKTSSFGGCNYERSSPNQIAADTKVLNVIFSFEDALRLNLAIDECVRKLNAYNRAKKKGKSAGLSVAIHLDKRRVTVHEGKL